MRTSAAAELKVTSPAPATLRGIPHGEHPDMARPTIPQTQHPRKRTFENRANIAGKFEALKAKTITIIKM
jgi:hypothetical protein